MISTVYAVNIRPAHRETPRPTKMLWQRPNEAGRLSRSKGQSFRKELLMSESLVRKSQSGQAALHF